MRFFIVIDGDPGEPSWFVDALHEAYQAVRQGAKRVVLMHIEDQVPLCVFIQPEEDS